MFNITGPSRRLTKHTSEGSKSPNCMVCCVFRGLRCILDQVTQVLVLRFPDPICPSNTNDQKRTVTLPCMAVVIMYLGARANVNNEK